jgi:hypothetical protein
VISRFLIFLKRSLGLSAGVEGEILREPGPICMLGHTHCYDLKWRCILCGNKPPVEERINWGRNLDGSPTRATRRAQERRREINEILADDSGEKMRPRWMDEK